MLYMDNFLSAHTEYERCNLEHDDWQFRIVSVPICFIIFGARMNISFIILSEDSRAH